MGALASAFSGLTAKTGGTPPGTAAPGKSGGQGVSGFKPKGPSLADRVAKLQKKTGAMPGVSPAMIAGMQQQLTPGTAMGSAPGQNLPQQRLSAPTQPPTGPAGG